MSIIELLKKQIRHAAKDKVQLTRMEISITRLYNAGLISSLALAQLDGTIMHHLARID
jgi:hypothetical protein